MKPNQSRCNLTEKDKQYILDNYLTMRVCEMAKVLDRYDSTVYKFMNKGGLETLCPRRKKLTHTGMFDDSKESYDRLFIGNYH
jgi:hypothetical protein